MAPKISNLDIQESIIKLTNEVQAYRKEVKTLVEKMSEMDKTVKVQGETIKLLKVQLKREMLKNNNQEQHNRRECLRIKNVPLDWKKRHDNAYVKKAVYDQVLGPILKLAVDDPVDELAEVPSLNDLLKNAHILPKSTETSNSVICRLNLMDLRARIFKFKKKFLAGNSNGLNITEDLTRMNIRVLSRLHENDEIESAWSMQGALFYTKKSDKENPKVKFRVKDPFSWLQARDLKDLEIELPEDRCDLIEEEND